VEGVEVRAGHGLAEGVEPLLGGRAAVREQGAGKPGGPAAVLDPAGEPAAVGIEPAGEFAEQHLHGAAEGFAAGAVEVVVAREAGGGVVGGLEPLAEEAVGFAADHAGDDGTAKRHEAGEEGQRLGHR